MSFSSLTFTIPSQKTVHLGEEAMRMVLSRMPVLTSLKVKKNIKIIIAKFIFRIIMIMIMPILWMRIRMILQLLTSLEVLSQDDVYWKHWLISQGFFVGS